MLMYLTHSQFFLVAMVYFQKQKSLRTAVTFFSKMPIRGKDISNVRVSTNAGQDKLTGSFLKKASRVLHG